jgi:hypothetical protein
VEFSVMAEVTLLIKELLARYLNYGYVSNVLWKMKCYNVCITSSSVLEREVVVKLLEVV